MKIYNPANGDLVQEVEETSTENIQVLFNDAKVAQKAWASESIDTRLAVIKKFHDLLLENKSELAKATSSEVGKPIGEAEGEIEGACYRISYFLENAKEVLEKKQVHIAGNTEEFLGYDPLGVIGNISAWNYPYLVGVNVFIPALLSGNAVMYKPSEFATLTGLGIQETMEKAGLPKDLLQVIIGAREAGEALTNLPLDGYFFTGSYQTGKAIAEKVAHKLVPIGLELGGKDPLYVTDNILSLDKAVSDAVEGAFYNNGQSCCAVERIYVHKSIYTEFTQKYAEQVKQLEINPLTRSQHLPFLASQVKDAKDKGAEVLCGGEKLDRDGNYFSPTAIANVSHEMLLMTEESFGPIIGIQEVESDQEAIELMNDTPYGLTAAIFCQDRDRSEKIMQQLNAGNVFQNCCDRVSPYLPWAGRGNSGLGATLSTIGILSFVQSKGFHHRTL